MTGREARTEARWEIIRAANKSIARRLTAPQRVPTLLGMRNLQAAVCVVRRNRLVTDDVLVAAGFRPARRREARA